jgi:hypothetical protein
MPNKFFLTDAQYSDGFELAEYNGTYSLIAARQSNDKVYQKWGELEIGKDKKKRLPVSVKLGDRYAAIDVLKNVIAELEGKQETAKDWQLAEPGTYDDGDDIPF